MYGIQFLQSVFAALRMESVQVRRGLGHALLVGTVRVHNQAPTAQKLPQRIHFSGEIRTSAGDHVAEIRPVTLRWWSERADDTVYLYAPVSFQALTILTESRKGTHDGVQLTFALTVNMEGPNDWQSLPVELPHRVPASDWLSLLEQARHTSHHTVEIPLEGAPVPSGLRPASDRFRAAIRHLELCQWDDAIAECRGVIEDLAPLIGPAEVSPPWQQYADRQKEGWTFADRCAAIRAILRHATHGAHHGGHDFTAAQARYIVDLTSVALKFYGRQLR